MTFVMWKRWLAFGLNDFRCYFFGMPIAWTAVRPAEPEVRRMDFNVSIGLYSAIILSADESV